MAAGFFSPAAGGRVYARAHAPPRRGSQTKAPCTFCAKRFLHFTFYARRRLRRQPQAPRAPSFYGDKGDVHVVVSTLFHYAGLLVLYSVTCAFVMRRLPIRYFPWRDFSDGGRAWWLRPLPQPFMPRKLPLNWTSRTFLFSESTSRPARACRRGCIGRLGSTRRATCKQLTPLNRKGWGRQRREWGNRLSVSCVRMRYQMASPDYPPAGAPSRHARASKKQGRTL